MTRADFYARLCGGGWRVARVVHRCDRMGLYGVRACDNRIEAGARYFDTNKPHLYSRNRHVKMVLCEQCANEDVE